MTQGPQLGVELRVDAELVVTQWPTEQTQPRCLQDLGGAGSRLVRADDDARSQLWASKDAPVRHGPQTFHAGS